MKQLISPLFFFFAYFRKLAAHEVEKMSPASLPGERRSYFKNNVINCLQLITLLLRSSCLYPLNLHKRQTTNDKRQTTNDKRQTTNDKRQTKNEKRKTKNEKRKTKNEKRKTKNEKRKTKNEKRKTKN